jgi:thymidylate kinase
MKIITFSGIDGAGKSTQIETLKSCLTHKGFQVKCLTFWDNVVMFSRLREWMSRKIFQGDQGVGSPEKPLQRRDKNVAAWPLTALRLVLYFADSISLRLTVNRLKHDRADVLIFDRYIYDELANLFLNRLPIRAFCRLALTISPKPDVALLIDADAETARARKPEYPLEFLRQNRNAYLALSRFAQEIVVIEPLTIQGAESTIKQLVLPKLSQSEAGLAALPQSALKW